MGSGSSSLCGFKELGPPVEEPETASAALAWLCEQKPQPLWAETTTLKALVTLALAPPALLVETTALGPCVRWWHALFSAKAYFKKCEGRLRALRMLTGLLWDASERSAAACRDIADAGGVSVLLKALAAPALSPKKLAAESPDIFRLYLAHVSLSVLRNLLRNEASAEHDFHKANGPAVLQKFIHLSEAGVRGKAILCFCEVARESATEETGDEEMIFLLKLLTDAISQPDHVARIFPFPAICLLQGLSRMSGVGSKKRRLVQLGLLESLRSALLQPSDDAELSAAVALLWSLAFARHNRPKIAAQQYVIQRIQRLVYHECLDVREAAKGCLWTLTLSGATGTGPQLAGSSSSCLTTPESASLEVGAERPDEEPWDVMLSHHPATQPSALQIARRLEDAGLRIWLHSQRKDGETLEAMAESIERARIVIIGFDAQYASSPKCRTEAEYALRLGKRLVPIALDDSFEADGWLKTLLGPTKVTHMGNSTAMNEEMTLLRLELGVVGDWVDDGRASASTAGLGDSTPSDSSERLSAVGGWGAAEVGAWVESQGLGGVASELAGLDGQGLLALRHMYRTAPGLYYSALQDQLHLRDNILLLLKFSAALHNLLKAQ